MSAPSRRAALQVVLFDLDGTLADTFKDLHWALNRALEEGGHAPAPAAAIRAVVSHGGRAMTQAALATTRANDAVIGDAQIDAVHQRFLQIYESNIATRTTLFEGMPELLTALDAADIRYGVVTNKQSRFAEPLIEQLKLSTRLSCLISGDSAARAKPHPDPLQLAAQRCAVTTDHCVYVGDARTDVLSAQAAHMPVAIAAWGYLGIDESPAQWGADALVEDPAMLCAWLLDEQRRYRPGASD